MYVTYRIRKQYDGSLMAKRKSVVIAGLIMSQALKKKKKILHFPKCNLMEYFISEGHCLLNNHIIQTLPPQFVKAGFLWYICL